MKSSLTSCWGATSRPCSACTIPRTRSIAAKVWSALGLGCSAACPRPVQRPPVGHDSSCAGIRSATGCSSARNTLGSPWSHLTSRWCAGHSRGSLEEHMLGKVEGKEEDPPPGPGTSTTTVRQRLRRSAIRTPFASTRGASCPAPRTASRSCRSGASSTWTGMVVGRTGKLLPTPTTLAAAWPPHSWRSSAERAQASRAMRPTLH
mmetsp:Transcript_45078/g.104260  ORF Transcript_45078/g.104260 Transcript_45078/m.104260 type:complete len:205 (-) Transcript_45078:1282-1896(-)